MKKEYMKPRMEVIEMRNECQILAGSTFPTGYGGEFGAPEFNSDNMQEMQSLLFN